MQIVYKVVGKEHRYGSNPTGWMYEQDKTVEDLKDLLDENPDIAQFCPVYKKGAVICEVENTAGILCFESKYYAKQFVYEHFSDVDVEIVKVEGIGQPLPLKRLMTGMFDITDFQYIKNHEFESTSWPLYIGTIAFHSVRVLE